MDLLAGVKGLSWITLNFIGSCHDSIEAADLSLLTLNPLMIRVNQYFCWLPICLALRNTMFYEPQGVSVGVYCKGQRLQVTKLIYINNLKLPRAGSHLTGWQCSKFTSSG